MQRLPTGSLIDGNPVSRCQLVLIDTKREWCPVSLVVFAEPRPALRTPNTDQTNEHQQQLNEDSKGSGNKRRMFRSKSTIKQRRLSLRTLRPQAIVITLVITYWR